MLRLFTFISLHRNLILFLGLELFAFFLIVKVNDSQRHLLGDAAMEVSASAYASKNQVNRYFGLSEENQKLMDENIELRSRLVQAERNLDSLQKDNPGLSLKMARVDSSKQKELFRYFSARVIKNSTHKSYNYLTLDQGREDGVEVDMGVVSSQGIVGRVIRVNDHYCLVLSALNVDFRVPLKALSPDGSQEAGNIGFYRWQDRNPYYANLNYIPETIKLENGYQVVTSGSSTIFPAGYKVGTVADLQEEGEDGFHKANIRLATDFHKLRSVYLIEATHKDSLQALEVNLPQG